MLPGCLVSEGKLLAAREVGNFSVIVLWDTGTNAGRKPGSQAAQYLLPLLTQRNRCVVTRDCTVHNVSLGNVVVVAVTAYTVKQLAIVSTD